MKGAPLEEAVAAFRARQLIVQGVTESITPLESRIAIDFQLLLAEKLMLIGAIAAAVTQKSLGAGS